jgi:hypothetical protein
MSTEAERDADNLTAISVPIVYTMWEGRHLRTQQVFTASYCISFTALFVDAVRTSQGSPPRPVTGIALLFICRCYSYLTGNTPPRHVTG